MTVLKAKSLFNPQGDTDKNSRRMIGGNTTNLNDFNNMKYTWASAWYRQARITGTCPGQRGRHLIKYSVSLCSWIPYRQPTCPASAST